MAEFGQKILDLVGMTNPDKANEDTNLKDAKEQQPAELTAKEDNTDNGGDGEDAESSSANSAKGKEYKSANRNDDEESTYDDDDAEDDIEDKLDDLVGETNMSNMETPCRRPGDLIIVVPCTEHIVDLKSNTGFFIMDMTTLAKKTETELQEYLKSMSEITGCIGLDCSVSLEEALEDADKPDEYFCPVEEGALHTTRADRSCTQHPDSSSTSNLVRTLLMTYRAMRKSNKRGIKCGDVPTISWKDLCQNKPVIPVSVNTALVYNTLGRSNGEFCDNALDSLPHYASIVYEKLLQKIKVGDVTLAPFLEHSPSLANRVLKVQRAETVCTLYSTAIKHNDNLSRSVKRKYRDLSINIEMLKKKPRMEAKPFYISGIPPKDHGLRIDPKWTDLILTCPPVKTRFVKQKGGGIESLGIFFETQLSRTYDEKLTCKSCVGARAGHDILDNYKGQGVRILLADQHATPVLCDNSEWCTVILRYSNMALEDMVEYFFLPCVKEGFTDEPYDKLGFRELLGEAMRRGLDIHLAVLSGTSLLTVGPAGYTEAINSIFQLTQSRIFKTNPEDHKERSRITQVSFPQPAIPSVEYICGEKEQQRMCLQHQFEACNLARISCTSASSKFANVERSETDLIGMVNLDRSPSDTTFGVHAHYFLGKLRQGGNPQFITPPAHLRLGAKVNWTSQERSDEKQALNPCFAIEWSFAMMKDWCGMNPVLRNNGPPSWTDMVMTRARQPNIIMGMKDYDRKLSECKDKEGDSFCCHPRKHQDPYTGSVEQVDIHKIVCWIVREDENVGTLADLDFMDIESSS